MRRWKLSAGALLWPLFASAALAPGGDVEAADPRLIGSLWFTVEAGVPRVLPLTMHCVDDEGVALFERCSRVELREHGMVKMSFTAAGYEHDDEWKWRYYRDESSDKWLYRDLKQGWWVVGEGAGGPCLSDSESMGVSDDIFIAGFEDVEVRWAKSVTEATGLALDLQSTHGSGRVRLQSLLNGLPLRLVEQSAARYLASGEPTAALALLEGVGLRMAPKNGVLACLVAEAKAGLGDHEAALRWNRRALKYSPSDAELRLLYASRLRRSGFLMEAAEEYQAALGAPSIDLGWYLDDLIKAQTMLKRGLVIKPIAERCRAEAHLRAEALADSKEQVRIGRDPRRSLNWTAPDNLVLECASPYHSLPCEGDWLLLRWTPGEHEPHKATELTGFYQKSDTECDGALYESVDCFANLFGRGACKLLLLNGTWHLSTDANCDDLARSPQFVGRLIIEEQSYRDRRRPFVASLLSLVAVFLLFRQRRPAKKRRGQSSSPRHRQTTPRASSAKKKKLAEEKKQRPPRIAIEGPEGGDWETVRSPRDGPCTPATTPLNDDEGVWESVRSPRDASLGPAEQAMTPLKEVLGDVGEILDDFAVHQDAIEARLSSHRARLHSLRAILTNIPEGFVCPISCEIIEDPVFAADGFTYERACIEQWFAKNKDTSPTTNARLDHLNLTPNRAMKSHIASFLAECTKVQPSILTDPHNDHPEDDDDPHRSLFHHHANSGDSEPEDHWHDTTGPS